MAEYTFKTREPIPETTDKLHERIRELTAIKDELDTELALLLGQKPKYDVGTPWHCLRCDHSWLSKLPHKPRLCPQCKSQKFNVPPTYTYEERLARRKPLKGKLRAAQTVAPLPHSVLTRNDMVQHGGERAGEIVSSRINTGHGLLPEDRREFDSPTMSNPLDVSLAPPPQAPMSLRERLAKMKTLGDKDIANAVRTAVDKTISEDELVQAINGEPDAT